jgi:hypothetical protein
MRVKFLACTLSVNKYLNGTVARFKNKIYSSPVFWNSIPLFVGF